MVKNRRHDIVKASKYKTSVCSFYLSAEGCPFGDCCAFAHGLNEIRCEVENAKKLSSVKKVADTTAGDTDTRSCGVADCVVSSSDSGDPTVNVVTDPLPCKPVTKMNDTLLTLQPESSLEKSSVKSKEDFVPEMCPTLSGEIGGRDVKPPLKTTKCNRDHVGRKGKVNSKTKNRDPLCNRTRKNLLFEHAQCGGVHNYTRSEMNDAKGVLESTNNSLALPVFSTLPPGTVLLPYSGCVPSFVTQGSAALSVLFGAEQMSCFGNAAGTAAIAAPTTENDFSLHYSPYSGFSMPPLYGHGATALPSDHDQRQPSLQSSVMNFAPTSVQPNLTRDPNTAIPYCRNGLWPLHSDQATPQMTLETGEEINDTQNGNYCERKDIITGDAETHDEGPCVMAEWNAEIEKWLKHEKANPNPKSGKEVLCELNGVYSLSAEGSVRTKDVLSNFFHASKNEVLKTSTEAADGNETRKKTLECDGSLPSLFTELKKIYSTKLGTDIGNGKTSFEYFDLQVGEAQVEDTISTQGRHVSPQSNEKLILSTSDDSCNRRIHCVSNYAHKHRPVLKNHFHSTCRAACQSVIFRYAEKNSVPLLFNDDSIKKDCKLSDKGVCGKSCTFKNADCSYDYCI